VIPPSPTLLPLDIEFPLRTRAEDATLASRAPGESAADNGAWADGAASARPPLPFLVERLLSAAGPFGLEVEVKSDDRVVGSWGLEVNPRAAGDAYASQARADLHVCVSARGDARATGAFLVLRHWAVNTSDSRQLEELYASLSVATLERLDALLGGARPEAGDAPGCVLFLVDGLSGDRRLFRLERLQVRLLEDLEGEHPIAGFDLRIAHGRGTGTRPHVFLASTLSTPLAADADSATRARQDGTQAAARGALNSELFVAETVSNENLHWNRRASDRARLIQASAERT